LQLHPGRILGMVMGLVILVAIFLLPIGEDSSTLYGIVSPKISDLSQLQSGGDSAALTYAYILIIAFILLVIAGAVGIFPLGTGVLGVVGMAMITASPYLVYPNGLPQGEVTLSTGAGFYVMWAASIISLGASFWHGKKKETTPPVSVMVTQTQNVGTQAPPPAKTAKCPNCGTENPLETTICSKCGKDLPKAT
jgi:membrane-bound ClpP family serine protease